MGCFRVEILALVPQIFHPEMVFWPNLCVNLCACLCAGHQVAPAQPLDFFDLGQTGTRPAGVGLSTRSV